MLTLTDAARAHLAVVLETGDYPEGVAVRFTSRDSGVCIALDNRRRGDVTFQYEGRAVLLLDQETADYLSGGTVDVERTDAGGRLFLSRMEPDAMR